MLDFVVYGLYIVYGYIGLSIVYGYIGLSIVYGSKCE